MTLSVTIDKYVYLAMNQCQDPHLRIIYSEMELCNSVDEIKHDRVKAALTQFEIKDHFELCSFSDVDIHGSGLGASSSFTVGLVDGLNYLKYGDFISFNQLAEFACQIEIFHCHAPIGKQDQYAAAHGGFNAIHYAPNEVHVEEVMFYHDIKQTTLDELNKNLYLFHTNIPRGSGNLILEKQVKQLQAKNLITMESTKRLVDQCKEALYFLKQDRLDDFGKLLDEAWYWKKVINPYASNDRIDTMYEIAKKAGALGGKILGAGGGGYLLVYCPQKRSEKLLNSMSRYSRLDFQFNYDCCSTEIV